MYSYCPHYRFATLTVSDVCGACICLAFGFNVIPVVTFDLLAFLVITLFIDRGSRRCHCLLLGSCIRSAFWMLNQLWRFKPQCYSSVLSLNLEQFHFSASTKRSQLFLYIFSLYHMLKKSCDIWMTNQVVIYFSYVGRGGRASILLLHARYSQVKYCDTLNVYWYLYPLVSASFLACSCICVFLCNLTLL